MFRIKFFKKIPTILLEGIKIFIDKSARKLPLAILIGWSLDIARYFEFTKPEKDPRLLFDMKNEKTLRMEELESGQQEMQEKIAQITKMVTNLTKGKRITDDPKEPASWKGNIDLSIVPNLNDCCEQEELRKNPSEWSNHVDMQ